MESDALITFCKDPLELNQYDRAENLWINMVPGLRPDEPSKIMNSQEKLISMKIKAQYSRKEQAKITKLSASYQPSMCVQST